MLGCQGGLNEQVLPSGLPVCHALATCFRTIGARAGRIELEQLVVASDYLVAQLPRCPTASLPNYLVAQT